MNCIGYASYKEYFKDYLVAQADRGAVGKLAEILECDRTYVSQVLNGKADLLPDHIARFCDSMSFTRFESDYLMNLLLKNKSTKSKAKKYFDSRLEQIISESTELSKKYQRDPRTPQVHSEEQKTLYYSNLNYALIHILTSVREFQTVSAISKKMTLPDFEVLKILKDLVEMKLINVEGGRYVHSGKTIYLDRQSPQVTNLHLNTRIMSAQRSRVATDIHFSHVFSVGKEDMRDLRIQLAKVIDDFREQIHRSPSEQVGIFCCDFFEV